LSDLASAYAAHGAGRLDEAETGYRAVLSAEPKNAEAWHLLGVIALQRGQAPAAVEHIERALRLSGPRGAYLVNLGLALQTGGRSAEAVVALQQATALEPGSFEGHIALGNALKSLGRLEEAIASYRQALTLKPDNASAYNNMGNTMHALGRLDEAATCLQRAVALEPTHARAHFNLGMALKDGGKFDEAAASVRRAVVLMPDNVAGFCELAGLYKRLGKPELAAENLLAAIALNPHDPIILNNLGNALIDDGRLEEAEPHLRKAAALAPNSPETHYNLGNALKRLGKHEEAEAAYNTAIALKPGFVKPRINLGVVLRRAGKFEAALAAYDGATRADPKFPGGFNGKGVTLQALGRDDEALENFQRALDIQPDFAEAHRNKAIALLMSGNFKAGWEAYEWRFRVEKSNLGFREFPHPQWQGENDGAGILIWGEQGLGDKVLYAGMIPDLLARGHSVVMETDRRLVGLFERSFPGLRAVVKSNPPDELTHRADIRWQTPLASLGQWLRPDAASFPARRAYLRADEGRRAGFRRILDNADQRGPVVGISWGSLSPKIGQHKTMDLKHWAPIFRIPGVRFVDLQYGDTAAERAAVEADLGIPITHMPDLSLNDDIDGVAALAAACDLVITVSNTTAHIAAALGRPTWVLVPASAANLWYWMRGQNYTPWYPSVEIFRQPRLGEWQAIVTEIESRLKNWKPATAQ
jgi:Flp pilus assembly protein TadD